MSCSRTQQCDSGESQTSDPDLESNTLPMMKLVLSHHSKIDKTKVVKTNGSLMKVKSIAECYTFNLH